MILEEVKSLIAQDTRFVYKGKGNNLGLYATDSDTYIDFTKRIGNKSFGKSTILLLQDNDLGLLIKIEMWLPSYCEWYTVFEGYLETPQDFITIFRLLGI